MRGKIRFQDIVGLIYPRICVGCNTELLESELDVCLVCLHKIPKTYYSNIIDNEAAQLFWGKVSFEQAFSFMYFRKNSFVEKLVYAIKYRGATDLAFKLGYDFGLEILKIIDNSKIDLIVPVPLHTKKRRIRGYNQSEFIANGLASSLTKSVVTDVLVRDVYNKSITHSLRSERWKLVEGSMEINNRDSIKNKSILLIDDVLTTGSTLEVCASKLWEAEISRLFIATLARRT